VVVGVGEKCDNQVSVSLRVVAITRRSIGTGAFVRQVRLKSVLTNSGFLERCKVNFAPNMTCIIGARGTCKSTVVESIRFAFDVNQERIAELTRPDGMITKTLGAGSVRCTVEVEEGGQIVEYTIDREIDGAPRVLRDGARDALADDVLHDLEIYSQGALQQIASADKPQLRLQLIDRPNRVKGGVKLDRWGGVKVDQRSS